MEPHTLIVETVSHVQKITLHRPEALNALNAPLLRELADAVSAADADADIRCILLTGSQKAFAAGADIAEMSEKTFSQITQEDLFGADVQRFLACRKPILAAVAGYALGGGCELAMMCDFIIAADNAQFGQPEINLGVIPGIGGTQRLTRALGKAKSMEMHLTGRLIDAQEAERMGLVSRIVPADQLMEDAMQTARLIASKSLPSLMAAKEAVNRAQELALREGLLFERRLFLSLFATEDQKEGMRAFLEKRKPRFQDR